MVSCGAWRITEDRAHATAGGDRKQKIAERYWRGVAALRFVLAADGSHNTDAPGFLVPVSLDRVGGKALLGDTPNQRWEIATNYVQPRRLTGDVAVVPLLNLTGPAAFKISGNPPARRRLEEPKATPGVTVRGMLKDAAPFAHRSKRGGKAAGIIAEFVLVRLPRRPVPVPAPAFAGRMRHDRVRPAVQPGIARLVPRVHVRQSEVAT